MCIEFRWGRGDEGGHQLETSQFQKAPDSEFHLASLIKGTLPRWEWRGAFVVIVAAAAAAAAAWISLSVTVFLQRLMIWIQTWPGWGLWVSPAVCRWSASTPSALWKPLCSTRTPAPSSSPDLYFGPAAAPRLQPIPTQRRTRTTCQVGDGGREPS